jgi:hypothetical protein
MIFFLFILLFLVKRKRGEIVIYQLNLSHDPAKRRNEKKKGTFFFGSRRIHHKFLSFSSFVKGKSSLCATLRIYEVDGWIKCGERHAPLFFFREGW